MAAGSISCGDRDEDAERARASHVASLLGT